VLQILEECDTALQNKPHGLDLVLETIMSGLPIAVRTISFLIDLFIGLEIE
jgi:hypothetical protein